MSLAQLDYTTFQEQSHPNRHTVSDPIYSHPAAIRVEDLEQLRASGPSQKKRVIRKIGRAGEGSPAIVTGCPTPFLVVCRDGVSRFVGCNRAHCQACRSERDMKLFRLVEAELKQAAADVQYVMGGFTQAAQGLCTALPDKVVREAVMTALKAVRRARTGGRGRPSWPGCSLEYIRSVGVNDGGVLAGVHHHHLLLKVAALPGAELPSIEDLRAELLFYYRKALAKGLPKKTSNEQAFDNGTQHLISLVLS